MIGAVRLHRFPAAVGAFVVLLAIGLMFSQQVGLPAADGPRVGRQLVLAIAPALLGIVALPVAGELGATLWRGRWLARAGSAVTVGGTGLLGVVLWPRGGVHGGELDYEVTVVLLLSSAAVLLARRFGSRGPLVSSVLSLLFCLYWDGIAQLLGFGGFDLVDGVWGDMSWRGHASLVASIALTAYTLAGGGSAPRSPNGDE